MNLFCIFLGFSTIMRFVVLSLAIFMRRIAGGFDQDERIAEPSSLPSIDVSTSPPVRSFMDAVLEKRRQLYAVITTPPIPTRSPTKRGAELMVTLDSANEILEIESSVRLCSRPEEDLFSVESLPNHGVVYFSHRVDRDSPVHSGWIHLAFLEKASLSGLAPVPVAVGLERLIMGTDELPKSIMPLLIDFGESRGKDLNAIKEMGAASFEDSLRFGLSLIEAIRSLHMNSGIVHGHLDPVNVLFNREKVGFRGFSRSCFVGDATAQHNPDFKSTASFKQFAAPWELIRLNNCPTIYGDLYTAFALIVWMSTSDDKYISTGTLEELVGWKKKRQFTIPPGVPRVLLPKIGPIFKSIVKSVLKTNGEPTYDSIISKLTEMIDILGTRPVHKRILWEMDPSDIDASIVYLIQSRIDRDAGDDNYTPEDIERGYEDTPEGRLETGTLIKSDPFRLVFSVKDRPDIYISYYLDCSTNPTSVHPAIHFEWISRMSRMRPFIPPVSFVSPAGYLNIKPFSQLSDDQRRACLNGFHPLVRFVVHSSFEMNESIPSARSAVNMAVILSEMIQRIRPFHVDLSGNEFTYSDGRIVITDGSKIFFSPGPAADREQVNQIWELLNIALSSRTQPAIRSSLESMRAYIIGAEMVDYGVVHSQLLLLQQIVVSL
jgi:hypothetical protein